MGMRPERCATCRFADPDPLMSGHFTCHRRAPVILPVAHELTGKGAEASATWPGVGPDDWCGQWRPLPFPAGNESADPRDVQITFVSPDGSTETSTRGEPADEGDG